jgi:hypothetical protein
MAAPTVWIPNSAINVHEPRALGVDTEAALIELFGSAMFAKHRRGKCERTLSRRLAAEGVTFVEILQQLKASLATRLFTGRRHAISSLA